MPTDDLDGFCCQNLDCPDSGRRGAGNLSVCGHYGQAHHRLLYFRTCKARFSEFKGTPLFNSKLPHDKVLAILQHLADGCGVRQSARLVGVNKDTVTRLALLAGAHAERGKTGTSRQEARKRRIATNVKPFAGTLRVTNPVR